MTKKKSLKKQTKQNNFANIYHIEISQINICPHWAFTNKTKKKWKIFMIVLCFHYICGL